MSEFESVKSLAIRARHFHDLESPLACNSVKWALPKEHIVLERFPPNESLNLLSDRLNPRRQMFRHGFQALNELQPSCALSRQKLQAQKHACEGARHNRAVLIRRG